MPHTEKSYAQQYWSDLLGCFGVMPARMRLFEYGARRATTGNTGYIDLFWSGVVLGEAKSLGRDLDAAYRQALDYLEGGSIAQHEWPKHIIVTDFERFRLTELGEQVTTIEFTVDELPDHVDQLMFLAGVEAVTKREEEAASIHASRIMADLFRAMAGDEVDEAVGDAAPTDPEEEDRQVQQTSVFLTRILFLLYGDDAGLWEPDLFHRFVQFDTTGDTLGARLNTLFQLLNTPEERRRRVPESMAGFPYVNGSLFAEQMPQEFFDEKMREALLAACRFHWTRISPAIFGSMFQLVKSKEARRADGEHYTSEANILKVLGPLFLDELRTRADRLIANASTTVPQLVAFRDSLAGHVFLDPACGCGNFLVVAYRELRDIETDVIAEIRRRRGITQASLDATMETKLTIDQFHGFELNWWPAKIAETAMFLVDHQANRKLAVRVGLAPERLPIEITAHIHHGNALQLDWARAVPEPTGMTWVFGNPPFLGDHTRTKEQLQDMHDAWGGGKQLSRMDYVTAWHAKTLRLLHDRRGAFAFVTTSSITQGDQVARLFGPIFDEGWRIRFAHRTFAWDSEAPGKAAVHCVIVGFDNARDAVTKPRLWDYPDLQGAPEKVTLDHGTINAYLVDGPNVLVAKRSQPLAPDIRKTAYGSKATDGGNFIVEPEDYEEFAADPVAAKYLRRYVGSRELLHGTRRWCLWMAGDDFDPADLGRSRLLKARVEAVRDFRAASRAASTRDYPHHHLFRQIGDQPEEYLCIPSVVSENRLYYTAARLPATTISSNANFTVLDPDGLQFALMSSSMFITWQRAVGGRLKSDLRFASTLTWYTFPVPELSQTQRADLIAAGGQVLAARAKHPERSLADHYQPLAMAPELVRAHDAIDRVLDRVMGASRKLTSEESRLELLFARYAELTGAAG